MKSALLRSFLVYGRICKQGFEWCSNLKYMIYEQKNAEFRHFSARKVRIWRKEKLSNFSSPLKIYPFIFFFRAFFVLFLLRVCVENNGSLENLYNLSKIIFRKLIC